PCAGARPVLACGRSCREHDHGVEGAAAETVGRAAVQEVREVGGRGHVRILAGHDAAVAVVEPCGTQRPDADTGEGTYAGDAVGGAGSACAADQPSGVSARTATAAAMSRFMPSTIRDNLIKSKPPEAAAMWFTWPRGGSGTARHLKPAPTSHAAPGVGRGAFVRRDRGPLRHQLAGCLAEPSRARGRRSGAEPTQGHDPALPGGPHEAGAAAGCAHADVADRSRRARLARRGGAQAEEAVNE